MHANTNLVIIPSLGFALTKDAIQGVSVRIVERRKASIQMTERVAEPTLINSKDVSLVAKVSIYGEYVSIFSDEEVKEGDNVNIPIEIASDTMEDASEPFFSSAVYQQIIANLEAQRDSAEQALASARKANKEELENALKIAKSKLLMASKAPTRLVEYLSNIQVAQAQLSHLIPTITTHAFTPAPSDNEDEYEMQQSVVNPMNPQISNLKKIVEDNVNNYDKRIGFLSDCVNEVLADSQEESYVMTSDIRIGNTVYTVKDIINDIFA